MKPAKAFYPLAAWLIRLSMLLFSYVFFFDTIQAFNTKDINFYIACVFTLFSILLFVGGFLTKPTMTVVSAFILLGLSIYKLIVNFGSNTNTVVFALVISVSLVLFSVGNKK